ncbi:penicillin-binding protein 2 [Opitutaceae bacterium]
MADTVAERGDGLFEAHKGYNPRIIFFYPVVFLILLILGAGLAYRQLIRTEIYAEREKVQNQRRILVPGPRGNIYDRNGQLLVGNRPRFAVVLYLDELRGEFRREYVKVRSAYRDSGDKDLPNATQLEQIARFAVVDRYLQTINKALGRTGEVDAPALTRHFRSQLLLPFTLVDDLEPAEYARLLEQLPVTSPLQVYTSSTRSYPFGAAAAHTLGSVKIDDIDVAEDFPGADLKTFKMKGTTGRDGLEAQYDSVLQGETGGTIYRVDPAGYRIEPPLARHVPVQGKNLTTSLDIDLQRAAEKKLIENEMAGTAIALDVRTGEVLALANAPAYDLNETSPRISTAKFQQIEQQGGWLNRGIQGAYPPGSSFKILTAIAGMRAGWINPDSEIDCNGYYRVGNRMFPCHDGHAHGKIKLAEAISKSCNVFFYKHGIETTPEAIAAESRRFGLDKPTGIELPHETHRMLVPDPEWKKASGRGPWQPGDTANFSIGQGFLDVTPLQMATFMASFARGQVQTPPTLLHEDNRRALRTEAIGLPAAYYDAIVKGMEECTQTGTAKILTTLSSMRIPGLRIAGKTGTAQKDTPKGRINLAWFICFAPVENPQIAIAVMVEGDTPGEETGGGRYAVPVAQAILKTWWQKQQPQAPLTPAPIRTAQP